MLSRLFLPQLRRNRRRAGGHRLFLLLSTAASLSFTLLLLTTLTLTAAPASAAALTTVPEVKLLNMFVVPSTETPNTKDTVRALQDGFMAALYNTSMETDAGVPITVVEATPDNSGNYDDTAGIVQRALADHPDLFALMGPPLGAQLNELRTSGVLQDNSLIAWGNLYSWASEREWWGPHAAFFGQSSEVELLVLLRFLVYDLHYRRVGYMYFKGGTVGEPKLNVTLAQLSAMGHDAIDMVIYDEPMENGFNQTMFDAFADHRPQVTLMMGQTSAHARDFVTHLLTDPRTNTSKVLGFSANARSIYAALENLKEAGQLAIDDRQVYVADTTYLPTQDEFPHIRAFRQQMSKYIADGKSALAPASQPLYFDDNIHLGTMMVAGWIAGAAMVQSLKTVEALQSRKAFAQQVFRPNNNILIGEDLLLGNFGGDCNAAYAQQQYAVCRCNEGGRLGVLRAVGHDLAEVPMPGQTFVAAPQWCYPTEHFTIARPIAGLLLNITVPGSIPSTGIITQMAAGAEAAVLDIRSWGARSDNVLVTNSDIRVSWTVIDMLYADAATTVTEIHNHMVFTAVIGPVAHDLLSSGELIVDPITPKPHLDEGHSTTIYITPTLQQQAYVCYSNIRGGIRDGSLTADTTVVILHGVEDRQVAGFKNLVRRTAENFDLPEPDIQVVPPNGNIVPLLPTKGALFMLGTTPEDVPILYDHLAANPECLIIIEWTDFSKRYELIHQVFSAAINANRTDILWRLRTVTNLPMWTKGAATNTPLDGLTNMATVPPQPNNPARATRMAPEAFFQRSTTHTPQALEAWYATHLLFWIFSETETGVFSDTFLDQLYSQQMVNMDGLTLGPYRRCDSTTEVEGQAACVPQNYGARDLALLSGIQMFNTSFPYSSTPVTPAMVFREKDAPGLSTGALIGIVVGCVAGGLLILGAVVAIFMCCCMKRSARDNRSAPKDSKKPVTLVFTDIQSSTAMWAAVPTLMADAVTTHHSIIRQAIAKYKCYEVKTIGDSFMIACKSAFDAVSVAGTVQTAFLKRDWKTTDIDAAYRRFELEKEEKEDEDGYRAPTARLTPETYVKLWNGLRVRVGIHTGLSDIRQDEVTKGFDYYGETSNMAARTEAIGNGGQVLMTEAAWWALSHAERRSLNASSLGPVALRGVPYPVEMMQINAVPGRTFGPLRTEIQIEDLYKEEDDDEGASGLEQLSQATMTGASHAISAVLTSCFSPYSPAERIKGLQPVMQKWNLAVPPRPRTVSAADYAQGLINRLAIKMASVEESRRRANGHMSNTGTLKQQQMLSAARAAVAQRSLSSRPAISTTSSTFLRTGDVEALTRGGLGGAPSVGPSDSPKRRRTNQFDERVRTTNPLRPGSADDDDDIIFVPFPEKVEEL